MRRPLALVSAAITLLLVAGCSGTDTPVDADPEPTSTSESTPSDSTDGSSPAATLAGELVAGVDSAENFVELTDEVDPAPGEAYTSGAVIIDAGGACADEPRYEIVCGAILEIFDNVDEATARGGFLQASIASGDTPDAEVDFIREDGALLRLSIDLDADVIDAYNEIFGGEMMGALA